MDVKTGYLWKSNRNRLETMKILLWRGMTKANWKQKIKPISTGRERERGKQMSYSNDRD